jgi:hypothetical protein
MTRPTFRCGHARRPDNIRMADWGQMCATCRREVERRASARYRARKRA